ncbi:mitochondrial splicing system protein [Microbotryomycetes sp. JL201]|nr:mitochondrial splicing system protein [Microbotryomycetes sp. JL201]
MPRLRWARTITQWSNNMCPQPPRLPLPVNVRRAHDVAQAANGFAQPRTTQTIFAPATGRGKTAISIIRISGPDALQVYDRMTIAAHQTPTQSCTARHVNQPRPRRALLRKIVHPVTRQVLDEAIVLYFPASSSLTAQPTLELHTHGSPALTRLLLQTFPTLPGDFRLAEPGEFTRLALEAGKMDLTEVEGLRDLVEAETESQRKLAARQANGHMKRSFDAMRQTVIEASALIEALIDFGEDEGISQGVLDQSREKASSLRELINQHLSDGRRGEIIRNGIHLVIIGAPNAGKSSLLNWLAKREAAIVTSTPGTTRDVVELALDYHGLPVIVADTAGLRQTTDKVEAIGIERALMRADSSDIKLAVLSLPAIIRGGSVEIDELTLSLIDESTLILINKVDEKLFDERTALAIRDALKVAGKRWIGHCDESHGLWPISVQEGQGLSELSAALLKELKHRFDLSDDEAETPLVTNERHRRHLEQCSTYLTSFLDVSENADDVVEAAEELRYAMLELGKLTGHVDVETVLGEIFAGFCIGK